MQTRRPFQRIDWGKTFGREIRVIAAKGATWDEFARPHLPKGARSHAYVVKRVTSTGKLTHEQRFGKLKDAMTFAHDECGLSYARVCRLAETGRARARGAAFTLRLVGAGSRVK